MEQGWDEELEKRQEALKCRICNGTNPYICRCAKEAWLVEKVKWLQNQKQRITLSVEEEREWNNFKALSFPSRIKACATCNTGEYSCYCDCAKKSWLEWYNRERGDSAPLKPPVESNIKKPRSI